MSWLEDFGNGFISVPVKAYDTINSVGGKVFDKLDRVTEAGIDTFEGLGNMLKSPVVLVLVGGVVLVLLLK